MASQDLKNPLDPSAFPTITDLFISIIKVLIVVSIPIVVFFIIMAGFMYVTARGNPEKVQQASKALLYGIVGAVILLGSNAILIIVKNLATSF